MADKILEAFLKTQYDEVQVLNAQSDIFAVQALDGPPHQRYVAAIMAKGLVKDERGRIVEADGCAIGIWLPDDYLRRAEAAQVLTYLGPPRPWHPNFHFQLPYICLHLYPGMPLADMLSRLLEAWTWDLYATGSSLNGAAAQWARHQDPSRFPIDRPPMRRRRPATAGTRAERGGAARSSDADRRSGK